MKYLDDMPKSIQILAYIHYCFSAVLVIVSIIFMYMTNKMVKIKVFQRPFFEISLFITQSLLFGLCGSQVWITFKSLEVGENHHSNFMVTYLGFVLLRSLYESIIVLDTLKFNWQYISYLVFDTIFMISDGEFQCMFGFIIGLDLLFCLFILFEKLLCQNFFIELRDHYSVKKILNSEECLLVRKNNSQLFTHPKETNITENFVGDSVNNKMEINEYNFLKVECPDN